MSDALFRSVGNELDGHATWLARESGLAAGMSDADALGVLTRVMEAAIDLRECRAIRRLHARRGSRVDSFRAGYEEALGSMLLFLNTARNDICRRLDAQEAEREAVIGVQALAVWMRNPAVLPTSAPAR